MFYVVVLVHSFIIDVLDFYYIQWPNTFQKSK